MRVGFLRVVFLLNVFSVAFLWLSESALAAKDDSKYYQLHIPEQVVEEALQSLAKQVGKQLLFSHQSVDSLKSNAIKGRYTLPQALTQLLAGTGLSADQTDSGVIVITSANRNDYFGLGDDGMNSKKKLLASLVSFFVGSSGAVGVLAQEGGDGEKGWLLEEIVVTASRREQNLQNVGMAVSVVQPEEFTAVGLTSLGDVVAYTPGVDLRKGNSPVGGAVSVRGVGNVGGLVGGAATAGIYLDAVPTSSNSPHGNAGQFAFDGMLGDIERVEFLKGPQGTLYGSTSIGGAIKYITRKPSLDESRGHASADISDTKEGGLSQIYNGRFSTPIIEDKLGITFAGYWEDNGGVVDYLSADTGALLREDADAYERYGLSADLYYHISDRVSFRGRVLNQKADYSGESAIDIDPDTKKPLHGSLAVRGGIEGDRSLENSFYAGTIEIEFDGAVLTSSSAYLKESLTNDNELSGDDFPQATRDFFVGLYPDRPGFGDVLASFVTTTDVGSRKFVQEIQLASDSSETWEWIAGLYYADEETNNDSSSILQPGDVSFSISQQPSEYSEYAAFGNLTYYIKPELDLTVGARLSNTDMTFEEISTSDSPLMGDSILPRTEVKDTVDTWSFALRYRPDENLSLYARAANGYRPATANPPKPFANGSGAVRDFVESDSLWSYEVGAKGGLSDGLLSYDLALWYLDWDNYQAVFLFETPTGVAGARANAAGGITGKGFEGSVSLRPVEGLSIISSIAYTDSALNEDEPAIDGEKGQQLPYIPKWTFSSRVNYEVALNDQLDASMGLGLRYDGSRRSAFEDGENSDAFVNLSADSYWLVDMDAALRWDNYSLGFYATNLLNEYALATVFANTFRTRAIPVEPRTYGMRLSMDF